MWLFLCFCQTTLENSQEDPGTGAGHRLKAFLADLEKVLHQLVRIAVVDGVVRELDGTAEQETGQMIHAVLVEQSQRLGGAELDADSPGEHFDLPGVVV